jgi:hypothetical protein
MNPAMHQVLVKQREKIARRQMDFRPPRFVQPVIIVSAPRAGSTLLFETLAHFSDLWTIGEESHEIIEGISDLHPAARGYRSNRLLAMDATPEIKTELCDRFARQLRDCRGRSFIELPVVERPSEVRFLEKTPKNALRIPFLRALFPDARFIFLYRDPAENISSIIEGWQSQKFIAYHALPGWNGAWSFLLIPGWEKLADRSRVEIAAHQWRVANETILSDLVLLPRKDWLFVRYADLVSAPGSTIRRIAVFADLTWDATIDQIVSRGLPLSRMTLSAPAPDKWRKHAAELQAVLPGVAPLIENIEIISQRAHGV